MNRTKPWMVLLGAVTLAAVAGAAQAADCPTVFKRVDIGNDCKPSEDWVVIFKNTFAKAPLSARRPAQVCWQASALPNTHTLTITPKYPAVLPERDAFVWGMPNEREIRGNSANKFVSSGAPFRTGDFEYTITIKDDTDTEVCEVDPGVIIRD